MRAEVIAINTRRGMVGLLTEKGDCSIFELLGEDAVEIGDTIEWDEPTLLGLEEVANVTHGTAFDVVFQHHHIMRINLYARLLLHERE